MADDHSRSNELTGAQLLVRTLEELGADTVFGYPGGAIMPVYDALVGSGLRHILSRHEQGSAFAAGGYARATGKVGVCIATSGPGATNLITGIADAYADSVPLVAITGQVGWPVLGTDAFQEVDTLGLTLPIVKHSWIVERAEDIPSMLRRAFEIASEGRPGPVLIDLPKDVASAMVQSPGRAPQAGRVARPSAHPHWAEEALAMLEEAERPMLYIGGGVIAAEAHEALRLLMSERGLPAVSTLNGLGCVDPDEPLFLGMLGMHGWKAANLAVQQSDLLVCCGARFDDRATGRLDGFAPEASVIHLDADPAEVGKLRSALRLVGEMGLGLKSLLGHRLMIDPWRELVASLKASSEFDYDAPGREVFAPRLLKRLTDLAGDDLIVTCDVGQHQMWVAQHCRFSRPRSHLTSGGLGAMGFGIPAGIGAKLARPGAEVVTVTGDGSIMMNIQELATLKRYNIPLKILLLDNGRLGLVRQWQALFYAENYSEIDLSDNPDFVTLARAFGIDAFALDRAADEESALRRLLDAEGPCLLHVRIDPAANVWPLVPQGADNGQMLEGEAA
ncbi:MAG TPA: acetolactate synthase 2 catalytic subunit [Sphingomicrobium sp.]|nr:acetolactate synthase 2 catalytic subunit [Sphingomicrobium sp.]